MRSCILTVIKNEHEYLDEWIKYHLDLGVDHIFILEDIDSDSHKDICNKYGDKVTLDSVLSVLNEAQRQEAKEVKELNKYCVQRIYFRNGLHELKRLYSDKYDWCFEIDNDEFITLENESDTLNSVLELYNGYDAFIMSWKCYGANGLIDKPDYSNKGVVETYTNEANVYHQVKPCYRLSNFRNSFLTAHHCPTNICNWCNTAYMKDNTNDVFNKIYLRHYITRSWSEYVWKRTSRGYAWGGKRNMNFFFAVNPDMVDKKEELVNGLDLGTLVVLPYKQSSAQGNEIRLALSGWRKFCQFKYHFVVIGEFNESLREEFPWIEFLNCPTKRKKEGQYNPHLDMENKFKVAARRYAQIYDGFIFMTDDKYAIKPFDLKDVTSVFYHSKSFTGRQDQPTSYWNHDKWKTRQLLDRENLPHINYATHHPCYFEFKKLKEIREKYNLLEESYVFHDLYFNYFEHEEPILDSTIRLGIWNYNIYKNEFQNAVDNPNIKFMCNSVEGWSTDLEKSLWEILK